MNSSGSNSSSSITYSNFDRYSVSAYVFIPTILINFIFVAFVLAKSNLRIQSNVIVCSSCVSALVFGLVIVGSAVVSRMKNRLLRFLLLTCVFGHPTELTCAGIFNAHIVVISLERFYTVVYPFKYQRFATKRNVFIVLFLTWTIPICFIYILVILTSIHQAGHCYGWLTIPDLNIVFNYILVPIVLFLPSTITFITYSIILCKIYSIQRKTWSERCNLTLPQPSSTYQLMLQHRKALFQMFLVIGIYAIAFYPFFICYTAFLVIRSFLFLVLTYITYLFAIIYLGLHPILLIYFNASIKDEVKKCWKNTLRNCFLKRRKSTLVSSSQVIILSQPANSNYEEKNLSASPEFPIIELRLQHN